MSTVNFQIQPDDDTHLSSMELYGVRLQKIIDDFTEFDAVTKAYVDDKVLKAKQELTDGASDALDTFKELEEYLTNHPDLAGGIAEQINALSAAITAEATRASGIESGLASRVTAIEQDTTSADDISGVQDELNLTQTGAGLDHNGTYVAEDGRNYISGATSLKSADALLDTALGEAHTDRTGLRTDLDAQVTKQTADKLAADIDRNNIKVDFAFADSQIHQTLATAANERSSIDTAYKSADAFIRDRLVVLETDPTTQTQVNIVGNLLNELSANVTSGSAAILGDISVERAARIDGDNNLSTRVATLEADPTTATAVSTVASVEMLAVVLVDMEAVSLLSAFDCGVLVLLLSPAGDTLAGKLASSTSVILSRRRLMSVIKSLQTTKLSASKWSAMYLRPCRSM